MAPQGNSWRLLAAVAILLLEIPDLSLSQIPENQAGQSLELGSAERGEELFAGRIGLRNGGPPCAACHRAAGLPFPGGGRLGPDLTKISAKLGPLGIDPTLRTLYFPAMTPIYDPHPLTLAERADLRAFFHDEESSPATRSTTPVILLLALGGLVILVALTGIFGRGRMKSVRKRLIERAAGKGGSHP